VGQGGNPKLLKLATLQERALRQAEVASVMNAIRGPWRERMSGVDVHAFRKTHETWAQAQGVHPILIDKQLGHSTPGGGAALEAARSLVLASPTARKHYLDMTNSLLNARRSAEAVRALLDQATATLEESRAASASGHRMAHGPHSAPEGVGPQAS